MEDLIGTVADHTARDQKKEHNSLERVYFHLCNSKRLTTHSDYKFLTLQRGDLGNPDLKASPNRQETHVCTSERSKLGASVKQAVLLQTQGSQAATDDFVANPHQPVTKMLWKAQGQHADNREIASYMALKKCMNEPEFLPRCWASCLLQEGVLFKKREGDDSVYLSLGCKHRAAWGFRVEEETPGGYFRLAPAQNDLTVAKCRYRIKEMVECRIGLLPFRKDEMLQSEWVAIPTTVCTFW